MYILKYNNKYINFVPLQVWFLGLPKVLPHVVHAEATFRVEMRSVGVGHTKVSSGTTRTTDNAAHT